MKKVNCITFFSALLFFLFMGIATVNAQSYVSGDEASNLLRKELNTMLQNPPQTQLTATSAIGAGSPIERFQAKKTFLREVLDVLDRGNRTVEESIDDVYQDMYDPDRPVDVIGDIRFELLEMVRK